MNPSPSSNTMITDNGTGALALAPPGAAPGSLYPSSVQSTQGVQSPMNLEAFENAANFLERIERWLSVREVENASFQDALFVPQTGQQSQPAFFAAVTQGEHVRLAAQMTPPRSLLLTGDDAFEGPVECLVAHLVSERYWVPSLFAPAEIAERFAFAWSDTVGGNNHLHRTLRLMACESVITPPPTRGSMRLADDSDFDQILAWRVEMAREVKDGFSLKDLTAHTKRLVDGRQVHLWEDDFPVSMAVAAFSVSNTVMVHDVYTPVPLRNRGYAKAVVAALTQRLLDAGSWDRCALYADIRNPVSLGMYPKLGFKPLRDYQIRHFKP